MLEVDSVTQCGKNQQLFKKGDLPLKDPTNQRLLSISLSKMASYAANVLNSAGLMLKDDSREYLEQFVTSVVDHGIETIKVKYLSKVSPSNCVN